jgi:hypothetical protein
MRSDSRLGRHTLSRLIGQEGVDLMYILKKTATKRESPASTIIVTDILL